MFVVCSSRREMASSSVPVQRVVYVDQHGKVLAQHTAPVVLVICFFSTVTITYVNYFTLFFPFMAMQ